MADVTPKSWTTAAALVVAALLILLAFAWWSGVFETPPATSPEAREEMELDGDEPTAPPATQPPVEGSEPQQPY